MGEATAQATCPLQLDVLPANFQKHVDPKAPAPLRMMGAKALVPMGPKDMATALFMLTFDADPNVRETAAKSAAGLPDRVLAVALRDETADPRVLDYYVSALASKLEYLEMLVLNPSTPDEAVARVAAMPQEKLVEIVAQNQLRILRHDGIVRALIANPVTRPSTADNITDFCVRSGLVLADMPAFQAARKRVLGAGVDEREAAEAAAKAALEEAGAVEALEEIGAADTAGETPEEPKEDEELDADGKRKRLTIKQQIQKLSIAKKIEWANKKGNKEVRTILLRDPNKLVQLAVVQSARITDGEIAKIASSRTSPNEVLQHIYNNRLLMKNSPRSRWRWQCASSPSCGRASSSRSPRTATSPARCRPRPRSSWKRRSDRPSRRVPRRPRQERSAAEYGGGWRQCAAGRLPAGHAMPILDGEGAAMGHPVESSAAPAQQDVRFEPRRVEKPWGYELLQPGDSMRIRPGTIHRMVALTDCDVLEASTPELDDVVRLEDRYGRS